MQRPSSHQIDEIAQRVFRDSLPPSWVVNEHHRDYGKDFLIEIGEEDGELTGTSIYVQLKGQQKSRFIKQNTLATFPLESKHARYYAEKVKDLPVFLVVVNSTKKIGSWVFVQPILKVYRSWESKKSFTVHLPVANSLTDISGFRTAIENAQKWMRANHPTSIQDAVAAQKQRIISIDPRFDVKVSLNDDGNPHFTLTSNEKVPLKITFFNGGEKRISDLIEKGTKTVFEASQFSIEGSPLFETEQISKFAKLSIENTNTKEGICSLVAKDKEGNALASLPNISGRFEGGRTVQWFEGVLKNSPLSLKLQVSKNTEKQPFTLNWKLSKWNGQRLLSLAFFEHLYRFFDAAPRSDSGAIEMQIDGNDYPLGTCSFRDIGVVQHLRRWLECVRKSRKLAEHFKVNPLWNWEAMEHDAFDDVEELYAIIFEGQYDQPMPNCKLGFSSKRSGFLSDPIIDSGTPTDIKHISTWFYSLPGERIETGKIVTQLNHGLLTWDNRHDEHADPHISFRGTNETIVSKRLAKDDE